MGAGHRARRLMPSVIETPDSFRSALAGMAQADSNAGGRLS